MIVMFLFLQIKLLTTLRSFVNIYIKVLLKEIGLFDNKQKSAYISISENSQAIITQHVKNMEEVKLNIEEKKQQLPILLWIPKMHKKQSNRDLLPLHIVVQPNQFQP